MNLSKLQEHILNNSPEKTIVISSAASGKTALLTEKVRQVIKSNVEPTEIAVITFTRMAAAELIERLGDDYREGMFVGTIHSLANQLLLRCGIDTSSIVDQDDFDKLFLKVKENPYCIRSFDWLFLDEGQDSNEEQLEFIFEMINPAHFFAVGDPKQSIYIFNGAKPELFVKLSKRKDVKTFDMNENFRNGREILSFAKMLISKTGIYDTSIAKRPINGVVTKDTYYADKVARMIEANKPYKNWVILVRTNDEIDKRQRELEKRGIPTTTFKQGGLTKEDLKALMEEDTVKILTVHSAKGLEWNNVIAIGMRGYSMETSNLCYVAATRARNKLFWLYYPKKKEELAEIFNWDWS